MTHFKFIVHPPIERRFPVIAGRVASAPGAGLPDANLGNLMPIIDAIRAAGDVTALVGLDGLLTQSGLPNVADIVSGVSLGLGGDEGAYLPDPANMGDGGSVIDAILGGFSEMGGLGLVEGNGSQPGQNQQPEKPSPWSVEHTTTTTNEDGSVTKVTTLTTYDGDLLSGNGPQTVTVTVTVPTAASIVGDSLVLTEDMRTRAADAGILPQAVARVLENRAEESEHARREANAEAWANNAEAYLERTYRDPIDPDMGMSRPSALARAMMPRYLRGQSDRRSRLRLSGGPGGYQSEDYGPYAASRGGAPVRSITPGFSDAPVRLAPAAAVGDVLAAARRIRAGVNPGGRPLPPAQVSAVAQLLEAALTAKGFRP